MNRSLNSLKLIQNRSKGGGLRSSKERKVGQSGIYSDKKIFHRVSRDKSLSSDEGDDSIESALGIRHSGVSKSKSKTELGVGFKVGGNVLENSAKTL